MADDAETAIPLDLLDPDDHLAPYQQIARSIRRAIEARTIAPGDQLPAMVQLAKHYGVARMTVQQAVRLLRLEGLLVTRQGSGVFVRRQPEREATPEEFAAWAEPLQMQSILGRDVETEATASSAGGDVGTFHLDPLVAVRVIERLDAGWELWDSDGRWAWYKSMRLDEELPTQAEVELIMHVRFGHRPDSAATPG